MQVRVLGAVSVFRADGEAVQLGGLRVRALLALLALEPGKAVSASRLIDAIWPEEAPANAANALQMLAKRLRAALAPEQVVMTRPGGYALMIDAEDSDASRFADLAAEARCRWTTQDAATAAACLDAALELWRGPALSDLTAFPKLAAVATDLAEARLAAVEARADAYLALSRAPDLVRSLFAEAEAHPLRETLVARLIRVLVAAGRRSEALEVFRRTRELLASELGATPSAPLADAFATALRTDEPTDRPPVQTNLPHRLTSFVGRDAELGRISTLLMTRRLVTLVGPGGSGKSRLAVEAAARAAERWPDGCRLVELAPVTDSRWVVNAVLSTLGIPENARDAEPGPDPHERLTAALADRRMLLVIDNCEHLLAAAAALIEQVLTRCPGISVLATSREPISVAGEHLCPVSPLGLPVEGATAGEASRSPAVRLFLDRAAAVSPDFILTDGECAAVCAICRMLDGMPLAIELAATRMRALSPDRIVAGLDDRFQLLTSGSRTALPRHQTLRAAIAWSWDLLTAPERELARRFSVFAGGATADSVRQICGSSLETLASLVDKSLIEVCDGRYRMLDTIRAYAAEELAGVEDGTNVFRTHADHFIQMLEQAEPVLRTAQQAECVAWLAAEYDNCAAALGWAIEAGDTERSIRLAGGLMWHLMIRGRQAEMIRWRRALRELVPGDPPPGTAATYLACFYAPGLHDFLDPMQWKQLVDSSGEFDRLLSRAEAEEAKPNPLFAVAKALRAVERDGPNVLQQCIESDDPWIASVAALLRGGVRLTEGLHAEAVADLELAEAGFRRIGDDHGLGRVLLTLATAYVRIGRFSEAEPRMAAVSEATTRWTGADQAVSSFTWLAHLRYWSGDFAGASADLSRARGHLTDGTPVEILTPLLLVEADVARLGGDLGTAITLYAKMLGYLERVSVARDESAVSVPPSATAAEILARTSYAMALVTVGLHQATDTQLRAALDLVREPGNLPFLPAVGIGFAVAAAAEGDVGRAVAIVEGGAELPCRQGHGGPDAARLRADVEAALGIQGYAQAVRQSRRLSAIEYLELLNRR